MNCGHIYYKGIFITREDVRLWVGAQPEKEEKDVTNKILNVLRAYEEGNIQGETKEILEGWIKEFCKFWHMLIAVQERIEKENDQQELASIEEQLTQ